jgi:GT2 family glycosyltransferase
MIEREFPQVRMIKLGKNLGFSEGNNIGVRESRGDIVILVNNDAYVHPDFLKAILPHFDDQQVFSVAPKIYRKDGSTLMIGRTGAYFYRGIFRTKFSQDIYDSSVPCLFASGGSGAFDKVKYQHLGGLLDLLYCEDIELGYRAWKLKGWKSIYEPRSMVYHDVGTSFSKVYSRKQLRVLGNKSRLLFQWYSISDPLLVIEHLCWLPFLIISFLLKRKTAFLVAFVQALRGWRQFKEESRSRVPKLEGKLKDKEILKMVMEK